MGNPRLQKWLKIGALSLGLVIVVLVGLNFLPKKPQVPPKTLSRWKDTEIYKVDDDPDYLKNPEEYVTTEGSQYFMYKWEVYGDTTIDIEEYGGLSNTSYDALTEAGVIPNSPGDADVIPKDYNGERKTSIIRVKDVSLENDTEWVSTGKEYDINITRMCMESEGLNNFSDGPAEIVYDKLTGNFWIWSRHGRVFEFYPNWTFTGRIEGGLEEGKKIYAEDIYQNSSGYSYVVYGNRMDIYDPNWGLIKSKYFTGKLRNIHGVTKGPEGFWYFIGITPGHSSVIYKSHPNWTPVDKFKIGTEVESVVTGEKGLLWVLGGNRKVIEVYNTSLELIRSYNLSKKAGKGYYLGLEQVNNTWWTVALDTLKVHEFKNKEIKVEGPKIYAIIKGDWIKINESSPCEPWVYKGRLSNLYRKYRPSNTAPPKCFGRYSKVKTYRYPNSILFTAPLHDYIITSSPSRFNSEVWNSHFDVRVWGANSSEELIVPHFNKIRKWAKQNIWNETIRQPIGYYKGKEVSEILNMGVRQLYVGDTKRPTPFGNWKGNLRSDQHPYPISSIGGTIFVPVPIEPYLEVNQISLAANSAEWNISPREPEYKKTLQGLLIEFPISSRKNKSGLYYPHLSKTDNYEVTWGGEPTPHYWEDNNTLIATVNTTKFQGGLRIEE